MPVSDCMEWSTCETRNCSIAICYMWHEVSDHTAFGTDVVVLRDRIMT